MHTKILFSRLLMTAMLGTTACSAAAEPDDDARRGAPDTGDSAMSRQQAPVPPAALDAAGEGEDLADGAPTRGGAGAGTLPAIADFAAAGPFTPVPTQNVGPNRQYATVHPKELGRDGVKHPIFIWGPGGGGFPVVYASLLLHLASHGVVVIAYNSTPIGDELTNALDWLVAEAKRPGSVYYDKLDVGKVGMGGHSMGSLATFNLAKDARLTTTVHVNGGTFPPHAPLNNLSRPAIFLCGEVPNETSSPLSADTDIARPNCDLDFTAAKTPVWYGAVNKSGHTTILDNPLAPKRSPNDPLFKAYLGAITGWLRWHLAGDESAKSLFVGPSCGFCQQRDVWTIKQKMLD